MASDAKESPAGNEGATPERALAEKVERHIVEKLEKHLPDSPVQPAELAQTLAKIFAVEIREIMVSFSGPLPPPGMLKEYEAVLEGLAERLVARAEREQLFRHDMSRQQLAAAQRQLRHAAIKTYVGQAGAFILAMTAIGGGIWLLASGKNTEGLWSIIGALASLVAVFLGAKITDAVARSHQQSTGDNNGDGTASPS